MLLKAPVGRARTMALTLVPLAAVTVLVALVLVVDPVSYLARPPAVEELVVERTVLQPDNIRLEVRNDGAPDVTVAQVMVNNAFWSHSVEPRTVGRLGRATISIPYPWEEGIPLDVSLLTSTGVRIDHQIASPFPTPVFDAASVWDYALVGVLVGVVPVVLGLLWLPALHRAAPGTVQFLLALTVGLLVFLLVETVVEGIELGLAAPATLRGIELFALGLLTVVAALTWLQSRKSSVTPAGLSVAYLVALGIGLHNLGEGVAVGTAVAAGEVALGTALVLGFAIHNATEGLAIVAPLAGSESGSAPARRSRPALVHLPALAAVAGVPTVLGAWGGAFIATPAWSALAFGVAAGAIAQVAWTVGRTVVGRGGAMGVVVAGFLAGLVVMYLTSLFVAT